MASGWPPVILYSDMYVVYNIGSRRETIGVDLLTEYHQEHNPIDTAVITAVLEVHGHPVPLGTLAAHAPLPPLPALEALLVKPELAAWQAALNLAVDVAG